MTLLTVPELELLLVWLTQLILTVLLFPVAFRPPFRKGRTFYCKLQVARALQKTNEAGKHLITTAL